MRSNENKEPPKNVFDVLVYLFQRYIQKHIVIETSQELIAELDRAGFQHALIYKALNWVTNLSEIKQHLPKDYHNKQSMRVFSHKECQILDDECREFLLFLEREGILNPLTKELVITQTIELDNKKIDIPLIKWVTLMVLFDDPTQKEALKKLEFLILHEPEGKLH